jgi:hypothetical protein
MRLANLFHRLSGAELKPSANGILRSKRPENRSDSSRENNQSAKIDKYNGARPERINGHTKSAFANYDDKIKLNPEALNNLRRLVREDIDKSKVSSSLQNNRSVFVPDMKTDLAIMRDLEENNLLREDIFKSKDYHLKGHSISAFEATKKLHNNEYIGIVVPWLSDKNNIVIYWINSYRELERFNAVERITTLNTSSSLSEHEKKAAEMLKRLEGKKYTLNGLYRSRDEEDKSGQFPVRTCAMEALDLLQNRKMIKVADENFNCNFLRNLDDLFDYTKLLSF